MNIVKKIFNNPYKLLYAFVSRVPVLAKHIRDDKYLKIQYRSAFGKPLNLENPQTFNEKLQWLKLYDRNPEYTVMVDKYEVKKYVAERIGDEYIVPTLGVWDKFEDIDFDSLPNQFVLKCTHDSGGLAICRNKEEFNIEEARCKISKSLKQNFFWMGREWPYKNVKPQIIAEQYMEDCNTTRKSQGLTDYKFYCFNGEPRFLYVSKGLEDHSTARISFLTLDWNFAPYVRSDYAPFEELPPKPEKFNMMVGLAKKLSEGICFVRVDLYEINGKVYFSELTFSPCSGYMPFGNTMHDYEIGNMMDLRSSYGNLKGYHVQ